MRCSSSCSSSLLLDSAEVPFSPRAHPAFPPLRERAPERAIWRGGANAARFSQVTDEEILTAIEAVIGRSAALYAQIESVVWREDPGPEEVARLRDETVRATADWYAVHEGAPRVWDLARRDEWPSDLTRLSPAARAGLETFLESYGAEGNTSGNS